MEEFALRNAARTYFAIPAACLAGSAWMNIAMALYPSPRSFPLSMGAIVVGTFVNFIFILIVFAALGLPGYLAAALIWKTLAPKAYSTRVLSLYASGAIYGFVLGMLGSVAYGDDFTTPNLILAMASMGVAGIITALTFLAIAKGNISNSCH